MRFKWLCNDSDYVLQTVFDMVYHIEIFSEYVNYGTD